MDAQVYLSIHWVHRSFSSICHAAAHSSFTMNHREIVKYVHSIFHIAKYLNLSDEFRHILSYKRAYNSAKMVKYLPTYKKKKRKLTIF